MRETSLAGTGSKDLERVNEAWDWLGNTDGRELPMGATGARDDCGKDVGTGGDGVRSDGAMEVGDWRRFGIEVMSKPGGSTPNPTETTGKGGDVRRWHATS